MNHATINSTARKASIAANPEYYSWPEPEKEAFRAGLKGIELDRAKVVLLRDLCGVESTLNSVKQAWDEIPGSQIDSINQAQLLIRGIGDDHIFLNESFADGVTLLDFTTLYDYDYNDYLFQESAYKREDEHYPGRDYYALRFSLWARLIIENTLHYATLHSQADFIKQAIHEQSDTIIDTLIPHEYKEGKNHGKEEKGGFLWDLKLDAGGLEPQLEELQTRSYQYQEQLWLNLSQQFQRQPAVIYARKNFNEGENYIDYLFANEATLKKIRWRHFLVDCKPLLSDFSIVDDRIKQESEKARQYIEQQHQDILQNFDPKVVKLRKKRKVIIAPGALDDLLGD